MKKIIYTLVIILVIGTDSFSQSWTQKALMTDVGGRVSAIGCAVNGYGYVGLGQISGGTYAADFWAYDTTLNHWTKKADFPGGGRNGTVAYAVKGKLYAFFGIDNTYTCRNDVWEYDPSNNTWTQKNNFTGQGRFNARGFVINDSLIYIGTGTYGSGNNYLYDFWMYNPSNDTWVQKADFPGGKRMAAASFAINGIGYLGSGLYDSSTPMKDFWEYNPTTDTWSSIPDLPTTGRVGLVSFVINNEGYVGTGDDYTNLYVDFYKYNPQTNSWSQIISPPTNTRLSGIGFEIGKKGYMGTGWNKTNYYADFWMYNPIPGAYIDEIKSNINFAIYPNPATNSITIGTIQKSEINIFNIEGQLLKSITTNKNHTTIDISDLPKGIYFVKTITDKIISVDKFIKE